MTEFHQGDIVIASFPFSTLQGVKDRPCLILASCDSPQDYLAAYISSSDFAKVLPSFVPIGIQTTSETGLKLTSYVRADKLSMLHRSVIEGKIGVLPQDLLIKVKVALRRLLVL